MEGVQKLHRFLTSPSGRCSVPLSTSSWPPRKDTHNYRTAVFHVHVLVATGCVRASGWAVRHGCISCVCVCLWVSDRVGVGVTDTDRHIENWSLYSTMRVNCINMLHYFLHLTSDTLIRGKRYSAASTIALTSKQGNNKHCRAGESRETDEQRRWNLSKQQKQNVRSVDPDSKLQKL